MPSREFKTFWDIEKEKTWRIYLLFGFLILLYFIPIFIIWILVKFLIYLRLSLSNPAISFTLFGIDTWFVLIVAAIASYIHWYYSNTKVVTRILQILSGRYPDKNDEYHYIFQNVVDELETAVGGIKVERYILPTGAMNAFALADLKGRKVIGITEGLLSRLNRDELQSVVAHEMAHIVSNDSLQTTAVCSLFGLYSEAITGSSRVLTRSETGPVSFLPGESQRRATEGALAISVVIILFITNTLAQLVSMFVSREREYRADAEAVKFTRNPLSLASALYKIGTRWRGAGYGGENLAPIFILNPTGNRLDEQENFWADLFSTHPPLLKRLRAILNMGHADLSEVSQHLSKIRTIKTETEIKKPEFKFRIKHNNAWLGPFTIMQLMTLDWLNPKSTLKGIDQDKIIHAGDIPELNHFFKKRDEPFWKIKRLCPICREWLIVEDYEGLYIWRCAFCNGVLVEEDKLPRIFVRKDKGFTKKVQRIAEVLREDKRTRHPNFKLLLDMSHPRRCPKCGEPMLHKFYSYVYHVEIDECLKCHLIWFDENELEILQCLIEMEEEG